MFIVRILFYTVSLLLVFSFAKADNARADVVVPHSTPAPVLTMSKALWKTLSPEDKIDIMDAYGYEKYSNLHLKE